MDPYVYPGTETLINKFGIKDAHSLSIREGEIFALKCLEPLPEGQLDYAHLKAIHYHFFSELYEWAGKERTVDIAKQNSYFGNVNYLELDTF
jgi:cell filamentation protein